MRVVITGATGNIGTSLLLSLQREERVHEIVGLARRKPEIALRKVRFIACDVARDDLGPIFRGADAVVHLAWQLQPARDVRQLDHVNVQGSRRVFDAAGKAGVGALIYSSSVGAYSAGPKHRTVSEDWPTGGVPSCLYSRQKSRVEGILNVFERSFPDVRVVRMRPALVFKKAAAHEIHGLFLGPFLPNWVFSQSALRWVPSHPKLRFQAVHSLDVGDAFRRSLFAKAPGAFNLAADPVIDANRLADALSARKVKIPAGLMRGVTGLSYRMHLQPSEPGWIDMALQSPLMSTQRARALLGWEPKFSAMEALLELLSGLRRDVRAPTPPLGGPSEKPEAPLYGNQVRQF